MACDFCDQQATKLVSTALPDGEELYLCDRCWRNGRPKTLCPRCEDGPDDGTICMGCWDQ